MPTPLWMDNLRVNRRMFDIDRSIASLPQRKGNWRGAICVGTGPSLEGNVDALAQHQGERLLRSSFLVIACETAYKFLVERHIIPDIVITAEEQMPVALAFDGISEWYPCCSLVASTTACSFGLRLAHDAGADIFFYNSAHPFLVDDGRYVVGKLPRSVPALTPACGSILFHGVALARWLGLTDIALMGADFGVEIRRAPNGSSMIAKTHAGNWRVDGIPPEAINQSFDWHVRELEAHPLRPLRIVNASEGGRLEVFPKEPVLEWMKRLSVPTSKVLT